MTSLIEAEAKRWLALLSQERQRIYAECANIADDHAKGDEYGQAACDIADAIRKAAAEDRL